MDIALISMGKIQGKFPRLEHCCEELKENPIFHTEIALVYSALKKQGKKAEFYNGSFIKEEDVLKKLKNQSPKKIIYYLYTPYIIEKAGFLKKLSEISDLYLVIVPFFWRGKILKEYPFIKDIFYDAEKGLDINTEDVKIDYDDFNLDVYPRDNFFPVVISKYCPYNCTFCNAQKTGLMDRKLEIIEQELKYLKKKGFKKINLCGNNLNINKNKFIKLCKIMKKLNLKWTGDARINQMSEEIYQALKGTKGTLLFGVESANQEILNKIKKGLTIKQIEKNAEKLNKLKIPFRYTFMFGFPWDSKKTAQEMISLRKKVGALNYHCSFVASFPGMPLFKQMENFGLINEKDLDYDDFKNAYFEPFAPTLYLKKEEVRTLGKKIMLKGAFSKGVLKNILKTKKIREYPRLTWRGLKLLFYGKRTWKS
jgi:radical SAM superfamily enzyme YgiQ (UPF0313 family)